MDSFDQKKIVELAYKILQGKDSTEIGNFLIEDLPDTIPQKQAAIQEEQRRVELEEQMKQ